MGKGDIGTRVAASLPADMTQALVAARIGLAADSLSRSLHDKRAFSAVELAQLAEVLRVDLHWLITGADDPYRLVVVARHGAPRATGVRDDPAPEEDEPALNDIALAYRQAFRAWPPPLVKMPSRAAELRARLGIDFAQSFASRVQSRLDIDVIRLPEIRAAYTLRIGPRSVIAIPATGNWFHENWFIAEALGHLARHEGHLSHRDHEPSATAAHTYAADLLLPADHVRSLDWTTISPGGVADVVWQLGVSTDALQRRLQSLALPTSPHVHALLALSTPELLRRNWIGQHSHRLDAVTERMNDAAARRFPRKLQRTHLQLIADGALRSHTLAWMLGIGADALEVEAPAAPDPIDTDTLAAALDHVTVR